ncbi:MAG: transporter substrate-binding domain-containing protein, partial [Dehalococcoidales bacterium]
MIKTLIRFSLAPVLLFLLIVPAYSVESNDSDEPLLFLGNEKIAPIVYQENGEAKGIAVDIVKALGEKIGRQIEVEATDWNTAQQRVSSGEADALLQINPNPEREKVYDFSTELLKSEFSIFRSKGNISINNIHDLKGKRAGVESGGYPFYLLQNYGDIEIVIIPTWGDGFKMIDSGELDAVVVDRWIGEYELAKSRIRGIQVVEKPIESM